MLGRFDVSPADLLGRGGESEVYALDHERILRVYRDSAASEYAERRRDFYAWLAERRLPFEVPTVLEIGMVGGRVYSLERRMSGRVFSDVLPELQGSDRERALASYLAAAQAIGDVALPDRPFGEILAPGQPLQRESWSGFLWDRLMQTYEVSRIDLEEDVPEVEAVLAHVHAELRTLGAYRDTRLVHGDYFPGNVYVDETGQVSGVGDFGYSTVVGDPLLDVTGSIAFLEVVDSYRPDDTVHLIRLAQAAYGAEVVRRLGLYRLFYSFYFSGCKADDPRTYAWCIKNLR